MTVVEVGGDTLVLPVNSVPVTSPIYRTRSIERISSGSY
jgi:hypothetical protein